MYWSTEQKCRKFTRQMLYYLLFNMLSFPMALIYVIYCIYMGNLDTSTWNLPMNVVMPFDTQQIWGWFLKWIFEFGAAYSYFLSMTIPTIYFVCFCQYIVAICNHFELMVDAIRLDVEEIQSVKRGRKNHSNKWQSVRTKAVRMKLVVRPKLVQLIDFHVNVLE